MVRLVKSPGEVAVSMSQVFENMTAEVAARIVVERDLEVDPAKLSECIRHASRTRSRRLVSTARSRGPQDLVVAMTVEREVTAAAREAVTEASKPDDDCQEPSGIYQTMLVLLGK